MSYSFPKELQQLVERQLATGSYASEDEVLIDAMNALQDRKDRLRQWREEIHQRIAELDRGEGIELAGEQALLEFGEKLKAEMR